MRDTNTDWMNTMDSDTPVRRARIKLVDGRGGYRENSGRKPNSTNRMSMAAREAAARTGLLPHEILLSIARGEPQTLKVPNDKGEVKERLVGVSLEDVKDAAKAAAPYFAPKMSAVELISGVADDDLDELIKSAAAEAGFGLTTGGEGEEGEDEEAEDRPAGRRRSRAE